MVKWELTIYSIAYSFGIIICDVALKVFFKKKVKWEVDAAVVFHVILFALAVKYILGTN